ncbi:acetyltransferase, partial [Vibrio cholerae]|nr:acetyltransferase [Vibrio cholerae]
MRCQPLRRALCAQWSLRLRSFNVF